MRNFLSFNKAAKNMTKKLAPEKYFALPMNILLFTGLYPISYKHNFIIRFLFTIYGWALFIIFLLLNPISKAIALPSQTNLNELTDNISFLVNHVMAVVKIVVFFSKRNDLIRLVDAIQSPKFRHEDCSEKFSANYLIRRAVWTTQMSFGVFSIFVQGLIFSAIINAAFGVSEKILNVNGTEFLDFAISEEISNINVTEFSKICTQRQRNLPFLSWYPFSTETSPMYEIIFVYQISAIFIAAQIVMALDTLLVGFMIHIKVQFQILSHNLRFIKSHAINRQRVIDTSSQVATTISNRINYERTEQFIQTLELDLKRNVVHHQAIIELTQDLESVFTYQLLMQFICSLFAFCTLLWQVSSTPILSAKFASMISYLGATSFQLFIFCWFGNNMMLESLSVADAAWDSKWWEILSSRRYTNGIAMIIIRSQKMIVITAGGFADLSLDTFMMIIRAAYSVFALLKKMDP